MPKAIPLVIGLESAIGCDYMRDRNQLIFVEFIGNICCVDLFRPSTVAPAAGTSILRGNCCFDFDTGIVGGSGDVFWNQHAGAVCRLDPQGRAKLIDLGIVSFHSITAAWLQNLPYRSVPLGGDDGRGDQLVKGDVFAVVTNSGNIAKAQVLDCDYDLTIRWVTYRLGPRHRVLGTGYGRLHDVVVSADERHAYVTDGSGVLLRVDLANADRAHAEVVVSGLTRPHQIALDESRGQAYLVEFCSPGRVQRVDLATGRQATVANDLEWPIGLLLTRDARFAYVSEETNERVVNRTNRRVSRVELDTGRREVVANTLHHPYFLTWADPTWTSRAQALLIAERDPVDRVALIDPSRAPGSNVQHLAIAVPKRPSSIAVIGPGRLAVCSDTMITTLDLIDSAFRPDGPILLGIGYVPTNRIFYGYADTSGDPGYFFQVKQAPFSGDLPLMFNHERAFRQGARYYKVLVDGHEECQSWVDYCWNASANRFRLRTVRVSDGGHYRVRSPGQVWYHRWLGGTLRTSHLPDGLHTFGIQLFRDRHSASEIGSHSDPGRSVQLWIQNTLGEK